eukprot:CAMPEP_0201689200 /NCGR_PEP_ID=MMETSP0578-20130828/2817_1 /ASSEMBLY_ACC=CAM_ASM_000663 /TAXON_ID=267565 /ORGANISM="Skeletonema grethea, Strain CCMP 1804" /LENGTH=89 /DNA_ID=CAMNT_0048173755 /DNA_START=1005 /DNA_END=1271 /DNA_ORIENTATION=-
MIRSSTDDSSSDELTNQSTRGLKKKRFEESILRDSYYDRSCQRIHYDLDNVLSLDHQYTSATRSGYSDGKKQEGLTSTKFFFYDSDFEG